jgi:hypothetical protein
MFVYNLASDEQIRRCIFPWILIYHTVGFQIAEMNTSPTRVVALVVFGGQIQ